MVGNVLIDKTVGNVGGGDHIGYGGESDNHEYDQRYKNIRDVIGKGAGGFAMFHGSNSSNGNLM